MSRRHANVISALIVLPTGDCYTIQGHLRREVIRSWQNVLDPFPKRIRSEDREYLKHLPYAETRLESERLRDGFADCYKKDYPKAVVKLFANWDRMAVFCSSPEHWGHIRTANVVGSPFSSSQTVDLCRKAVQEDTKRDGGDLETSPGSGKALQHLKRTLVIDRCLQREKFPRWRY